MTGGHRVKHYERQAVEHAEAAQQQDVPTGLTDRLIEATLAQAYATLALMAIEDLVKR